MKIIATICRSWRRFALPLKTGVLFTTSTCTVGKTLMPNSSLWSLGMMGFLLASSVKVKRRMKSSSALQRNEEFRVGSFTKSIHLFLCFLASGRSSLCKGIACKTISFTTSGNAEHPPDTRLPGVLQVRKSETSDTSRYDTESTSQAS